MDFTVKEVFSGLFSLLGIAIGTLWYVIWSHKKDSHESDKKLREEIEQLRSRVAEIDRKLLEKVAQVEQKAANTSKLEREYYQVELEKRDAAIKELASELRKDIGDAVLSVKQYTDTTRDRIDGLYTALITLRGSNT